MRTPNAFLLAIAITLALGGGTITPDDNPVLIHELLHGYQHARSSPEGQTRVDAAFQRATGLGRWEPGEYMLSNVHEFFSMTASVAIFGRAARPPDTREQLRHAMPDYYGWLVQEFGLTP